MPEPVARHSKWSIMKNCPEGDTLHSIALIGNDLHIDYTAKDGQELSFSYDTDGLFDYCIYDPITDCASYVSRHEQKLYTSFRYEGGRIELYFKPERIERLLAKVQKDSTVKKAVMLLLFSCMFLAVTVAPWIHDYCLDISHIRRKFWLSVALFVVFAICICAMERKQKLFKPLGICVLAGALVAMTIYVHHRQPFLNWAPAIGSMALDALLVALMFVLYPKKEK